MTIEGNETTSSETVASDAISSAEVSQSSANGEDGSSEGGESAEVSAAPSFTPNLKFRVHDKEMEFEKWTHDIIKDADLEKRVREFHERAYGLDHVKADRTKLKQEISAVRGEYGTLQTRVNGVVSAVQRKDYDTALEALGIGEQDVLRHAKNILDRMNNPQLAQHHQQQRQYQTQLEQVQSQNEYYQQQYVDASVQAKNFEMAQVMARPDVTQTVMAFDAARGQGAFQDEVIKRGQYHFYATGQDITAEQAVKEVLDLLGPMGQPQQQQQAFQQAPAQQQVAQGQQVQAQAAKPVIPNIQGRGTSPTKKVPKSIDDLIKMRKEMEANG